MIKKNSLVLFQGDSITDCCRNYDDMNSLGMGYAMMSASLFNARYPELNVRFINKGISGNRAVDLKERWQKDCLDIKPDVVSILIGINDCWRKFDNNDETTVEEYKNNFRDILTQVKETLCAEIIIIEPFLLPVTKEQKTLWRADLDPKIQAARKLAREFGATYVPMDGIFASMCVKQQPEFWAGDGVHPSCAGHALIAEAWLSAVTK